MLFIHSLIPPCFLQPGCHYNGIVYATGDIFYQDDCAEYTCNAGTANPTGTTIEDCKFLFFSILRNKALLGCLFSFMGV